MNHLAVGVFAGLLCVGSAFAEVIYQDDFEDGNAAGWVTSGNVTVNGGTAIGNFALRHKKSAQSYIPVSTSGFNDVSITMNLAATSLESADDCYAEYSVDGGNQWLVLVELHNGDDTGEFISGTASPASASDNPNLRLRFRATGRNPGDYCWGDNVAVTGTAAPVNPEPDLIVLGNGAFSAQEVGTQLIRSLSIANAGSANLSIGALTGPATPFELVADDCSGIDLLPEQSCALSVSFSPVSAGTFSDQIIVPSNDPDASLVLVELSGNGFEPPSGEGFDPLFGTGDVSRNALASGTLLNGGDPGSRVNLSAYALPPNAAQPVNTFEGSLELFGEHSGGDFKKVKDSYRYTHNRRDAPIKHLPEFNFEFVQHGTHLIPVERGTMTDSHPNWEFIIEPGRVWQESADGAYSRAALPFTLHQKNANCMHNGVLTFLFRDDGATSKVAYQISSETCLYFQFDMWGLLNAQYSPAPVTEAPALKAAYEAEIARRMPVAPIASLGDAWPGANPGNFGSASETDPGAMTQFGLVANGIHYVGGCQTRHGAYPFCEHLVMPSYSLSKSVFAAQALLRMELKYPGYLAETVAARISECATEGTWDDVTYANVIDMATGNFNSALYMSDEGALTTNDFFLPLDHASKISFACGQYPRRVVPGSQWVYHTSDTYILGRAMNEDIKQLEGSDKDIFSDLLIGEVLGPLGISPPARVSRRTYDEVSQPFTGWGLSLLRDDVARVSDFLNVDEGRLEGTSLLDPLELASALQRDPGDRGLVVPSPGFRYNNGFWARDIAQEMGCPGELWVPFMSGYGGITVLLMPNGISYYVFSDNGTFEWIEAAREAHAMSSLCP